MGGSDDGFFGPSIEEQKEDIAALLATFDPTTNDRYTKAEHRVYPRQPFFRRQGKLTDTYAVAWWTSLSSGGPMNDPLTVDMAAALMPTVWVTGDAQLLRCDHRIDAWIVTALSEIPTWTYRGLQLGLRGDFETIDREFEADRRKYAASVVDEAIEKANSRQSSPLGAILLPPAIDTTTSDFAWRRQQCIETLLHNQSSSV